MIGHTSVIYSVAISQDKKYLVSGSSDKKIKIWNLEKRAEACTLGKHKGTVRAVAISHDGKYIASGSDDKIIKIWAFEQKRDEQTLQGTVLMIIV